MNEALIFQWPMVALPLAVLVYFELMRRLDRRWANRHSLTEEEVLSRLARDKGISEYEIFHLAAEGWSVGRSRVEDHFKGYLRRGDLPHYVRDYLRRHR